MSKSTDSIESAVATLFGGGEHSWDNFFYYLQRHPVVLPQNRVAELIEDSSDPLTDEIWFVFSVSGWSDKQNFKRVSQTSSFGGSYHGELYEVSGQEVTTYTWERV